MKNDNTNREIDVSALEGFTSTVARMKTYEEFGDNQPETCDWIQTLSNLIVRARAILGDNKLEREKKRPNSRKRRLTQI